MADEHGSTGLLENHVEAFLALGAMGASLDHNVSPEGIVSIL